MCCGKYFIENPGKKNQEPKTTRVVWQEKRRKMAKKMLSSTWIQFKQRSRKDRVGTQRATRCRQAAPGDAGSGGIERPEKETRMSILSACCGRHKAGSRSHTMV